MSTVVQRTYRPQQAAGLAGLIVDETRASVSTYQCGTSAGIGFGLAVSQGSGSDTQAVIGGASKFIGLTVRDVTLDGLPIDPLLDAIAPVDTYQQYANMAVMHTGHMWVVAHAIVAAGDALFYASADGTLSNSASGEAAFGYIDFTTNPVAGNTVTLQGSAISFVASGATGLQANIGATLGDTLVNLAAMQNASADTNLVLLTTRAYPPSPGGAGQGSGAYRLMVSSKAVGVAGNAYTLATNVPGATVSGATLAGGAAAAIAITGGFWLSNAITGDLAQVSLGIQR